MSPGPIPKNLKYGRDNVYTKLKHGVTKATRLYLQKFRSCRENAVVSVMALLGEGFGEEGTCDWSAQSEI